MVGHYNSWEEINHSVKSADPQQPITLGEMEEKKIRRSNIAYTFSQVITIISSLAIEGLLILPHLIVPVNTASYPYVQLSPEVPPMNTKKVLLATSGVTGFYFLSNGIYRPWKYQGKRSYWVKLLFKVTTIAFFGAGLLTLFYWFVSHRALDGEFGVGTKYGVYFRKSHSPKDNEKKKSRSYSIIT